MLSERKIYYWIPLSVEVCALYNSILIRYGIRYLYLFFLILGLLFLFRRKILCKFKPYFFSIALYIVSVILSSIIFLLSQATLSIIMGMIIYIFPLLYWLLYDERKVAFYFPQLILGLKYPILVIAILGIIQFYFSPGLFGLINLSGPVDPSVLKATSDVFPNWMIYLRATSILASPQVFGLFMVLYGVSFFIYAKKRTLNSILIAIYLFAGAHSGNKSFFLILLLFGGYYILKTAGLKKKVYVLLVASFLLSVVIYFSEEVSFLARIVNMENIADEEKEGRISIYKELLEKTSFWGDGAGTHQALSGEINDEPAESYFLQILVELGVIPFTCFLLIFLLGYIKDKRRINIMLFFIALSMGFVHCFNAFVFFIMWGWFFIFPPSINSSYTHLSNHKKNLYDICNYSSLQC